MSKALCWLLETEGRLAHHIGNSSSQEILLLSIHRMGTVDIGVSTILQWRLRHAVFTIFLIAVIKYLTKKVKEERVYFGSWF